jgi:hypothetical protein
MGASARGCCGLSSGRGAGAGSQRRQARTLADLSQAAASVAEIKQLLLLLPPGDQVVDGGHGTGDVILVIDCLLNLDVASRGKERPLSATA